MTPLSKDEISKDVNKLKYNGKNSKTISTISGVNLVKKHINVEQIVTESFLRSSVRVDYEKPTKKSSKKFDLRKPVFAQIQDGRHISEMKIL